MTGSVSQTRMSHLEGESTCEQSMEVVLIKEIPLASILIQKSCVRPLSAGDLSLAL